MLQLDSWNIKVPDRESVRANITLCTDIEIMILKKKNTIIIRCH